MQNQPGPPQQYPQPSSMGHGVKIGIGIAIGVLLMALIAMGACGVACVGLIGGGGALQRQEAQQASKALPVGEIGQKMVSGDIALTVEKVTSAAALSRYEQASAGRVYEIIDVLIQNYGKEKSSVNALYFTLKDSDGREYSVALSGAAPNFISTADLLPGDKLRGKVAFEVPKKVDSYILTYAPLSLFGNTDAIRVAFKG